MSNQICHNCLKSYEGKPAAKVKEGSQYAREYCPVCGPLVKRPANEIRSAGLSFKESK